MKKIGYDFKDIYKMKYRPLEPEKWSKDEDIKKIEYSAKVSVSKWNEFSLSDFEKDIIKKLTDMKIVVTEESHPLRFEFFNQHWEEDDCSLYVKVKLIYDETPTQAKLRKQLEKSIEK